MVHKCCVSVCGMSVRIPGAKGLSYHTFPAKEPTREKWIQAILPHVDKPESFRVVQGYTRVCSRHFKKKDYSMDSRKRARLSTNAVPTVFPAKNSPIIAESKTKHREATVKSSISGNPNEDTGSLEFSQDALGNLKIETSGRLQSCHFESVTISNDHLVLTFSEEETGSSKFSSQESLQIPTEATERETGKMRKRRKNRSEGTRLSSSGPKKRSSSSTSDDLNVNVVGDALAEINLSTLISASSSSDLQQELEPSTSSESGFRDSSNHKEIGVPHLEVVSHFDSLSSDYNVRINSTEIEQDLLQSIQAVSLNSGEPTSGPAPLFVATDVTVQASTSPELNISSICSPPFISQSEADSVLPNHIQDLYADLVDGGASLSLEDTGLAHFNNQDLMEALRSATEELELTTDIDQLARDLNVSLLDGALTSSILGMDAQSIRISDLDHSSLHSSFDFERDLMHLQELPQPVEISNNMIPPMITVSLESAAGDDTIPGGTSTAEVLEEPNSSPTEDIKLFASPKIEIKSETSSPERTGKKTTKKERAVGSFSVERFGDSDKDIEYYTGFPTFAKFEVFYRSLDIYVENLKVTDMMHGVANLAQVPSQTEVVSPNNESGEGVSEEKTPAPPVQEEQKRRLSQGRSMSRIDELFMTIIRLKRKIPEKVLGHMFCISQPTVSRIIRAWTMLLSRVLELLPAEKSSSSRKSSTNPSNSGNSSDGSSETAELGIPRSFRQLFYSELAQSIIASGAATNSRKTSSSTTCPSVSRSKRPKKEKLIVNMSETILSSTPSLVVSIIPEPGMSTTCLASSGIQTISTPNGPDDSVVSSGMGIGSDH